MSPASALELGLSGKLHLLHGVRHPGELNAELNEFWHAFKQATYGQEQRTHIVANFIESLYAPPTALGPAATDLAKHMPWQSASSPDWDQLANTLRANLPEGLNKSQQNDFESAATKIQRYASDETLTNSKMRSRAQTMFWHCHIQGTKRHYPRLCL